MSPCLASSSASRTAACGSPVRARSRKSAKLTAYDLLNAENRTSAERKLFAQVDAVACVLAHGGRYGSQETARLAGGARGFA